MKVTGMFCKLGTIIAIFVGLVVIASAVESNRNNLRGDTGTENAAAAATAAAAAASTDPDLVIGNNGAAVTVRPPGTTSSATSYMQQNFATTSEDSKDSKDSREGGNLWLGGGGGGGDGGGRGRDTGNSNDGEDWREGHGVALPNTLCPPGQIAVCKPLDNEGCSCFTPATTSGGNNSNRRSRRGPNGNPDLDGGLRRRNLQQLGLQVIPQDTPLVVEVDEEKDSVVSNKASGKND